MRGTQDIQTVGIVGGGIIGLSWASLFSAFGFQTHVYDPNPMVSADIGPFVRDAWAIMAELELGTVSDPELPRFSSDLASLNIVDFVQENGPDRIEIKQQTIQSLEQVVRPDVIIASSTSSLLASDIQRGARHAERILVAHPMNPPHMVPMVELVAGKLTAPEIIDRAEALYQRIERVTVRVKKEVVGHLANRLTSALYREAVHIAAEGIADVEDIDRAISYGPGMRWALMGPHLTYHLGGGKGGYRHYLDHLGATQEARWQEHGTPELTEAVKNMLVAGVDRELESQDEATLVKRRDAALAQVFKVKKTWGF
ncbi:3-hydroxybutyryl-CoA dehydrogenase [Phaeobacter gallaeciensis]|uniref:3-hydroxybutyryl-CoA dehydrogenase n=2 Tax=Roseobacteraceae TaxID=2854170 RepID=A0A366WWL1_9RHOB|nr:MULTISPECIES: 3-hydroxyacyl-CoA dehydrogenase NAD-binding domain-containing protein [Roseobacteraceae]MBT3142031.1 3-hydroxyacyl-CoA dehydrogenase [Falsiruegeria litorea]MBT8168623.1 3-hydroxyacyl-CoA dehydrogenase [Falsiruegeria litorea]RBW53906.1 3-hydroxybutyryl-CoA dehydrogenase [Phaeobacter gallaeciensis]